MAQNLSGMVRRCMDDYHMVTSGDTIAVGVSGGKDSLTLLSLLSQIREYYPEPFSLEAFTIDLGWEGMDFRPIQAYCNAIHVPYTIVPTKIKNVIFDIREEKNPCSMCARMRRGALGRALGEAGIHKIALGHHQDDAVETVFMGLLFNGKFSCFEPVTYLSRSGITQIRPMLYLSERAIAQYAVSAELPVVKNLCPADHHTKREEVKSLLSALSESYPDIQERVMHAIKTYPFSGWEKDT